MGVRSREPETTSGNRSIAPYGAMMARGPHATAHIARYTQRDVERLLKDDGIVRHRGKIEAVINNAQRARELVQSEGSLAACIWRHEPDPKRQAEPQTVSTSDESLAMSKELKNDIFCRSMCC